MLFSIALMLLCGMIAGWLCKKLHLPALMGMIVTGIALGPYALNLIDGTILSVSAELRKIALIIILTRAGLSLNMEDLKKVGRPAVLMCFLPACFEMVGMVLLAPRLLGLNMIEAALLGAVIGAVSPAVIVPKMLKLMEEGFGTEKSIPQLILAGASVDDVFVIVIFYAFLSLVQGGQMSPASFVKIPVSIAFGIGIGAIAGILLAYLFKRVHMRDTAKVLFFLSVSFLLVTAEDKLTGNITFSALIAVMCMGIALQKRRRPVAERLSVKFNKLWVGAELMLFILVGATVDLHYVQTAGWAAVILLFGVLVFRMAGVFFCLLGTKLSGKERLFCMIGYLPKATVQAAIGGIPLAAGLACGNVILAVAVMAILITAPLGAFLIDLTYKRLLERSIGQD